MSKLKQALCLTTVISMSVINFGYAYDSQNINESFALAVEDFKKAKSSKELAEYAFTLMHLSLTLGEEKDIQAAYAWSSVFLRYAHDLDAEEIKELNWKIEDAKNSIILRASITILESLLNRNFEKDATKTIMLDALEKTGSSKHHEIAKGVKCLLEGKRKSFLSNKIRNEVNALSASYPDIEVVLQIIKLVTDVKTIELQELNEIKYEEIMTRARKIKELLVKKSESKTCELHNEDMCESCHHVLRMADQVVDLYVKDARESKARGLYNIARIYFKKGLHPAANSIYDTIIRDYSDTQAYRHALLDKKAI